jgi:hypothetical protein
MVRCRPDLGNRIPPTSQFGHLAAEVTELITRELLASYAAFSSKSGGDLGGGQEGDQV